MRSLLPLLVLLAPVPLPAQQPEPTRLPPSLVASLDEHPALTYARYGERELQLDLYRPRDAPHPLPAILCIHGGGWFKGERGHLTNLARALAARGYVTATISYRLSGEAKFPAAIQDAKAAVRFLRAHAEPFGIADDAIGVTGLSAGGHLAALLATSAGVPALEGDGGHAEHSSAVQACVAMGAQSDLENERIRDLSARPDDPFYRTFLGAPQSEIPETYALASPRHHLDPRDPPLAFLTGALDDPSTRADETRRDLMRLGIPGGLTVIPRAPHAFLGQQRPFDHGVAACDAFFTLHLKHRGRPPLACDPPSLFPDNPRWQLVGAGFAACGDPHWDGETLRFAAPEDGLACQWSEPTGLAVQPAAEQGPASGPPQEPHRFASAPAPQGQLWVGTPDGIRILAPDGQEIGRLQTPGIPTGIAFGPGGRVGVTTRDACYVARLRGSGEPPPPSP